MDIKDIIKAIDQERFFVEFHYDNENDKIIIGAVKEKRNPSGLGRREFAIINKEEKVQFLKKMAEIM